MNQSCLGCIAPGFSSWPRERQGLWRAGALWSDLEVVPSDRDANAHHLLTLLANEALLSSYPAYQFSRSCHRYPSWVQNFSQGAVQSITSPTSPPVSSCHVCIIHKPSIFCMCLGDIKKIGYDSGRLAAFMHMCALKASLLFLKCRFQEHTHKWEVPNKLIKMNSIPFSSNLCFFFYFF